MDADNTDTEEKFIPLLELTDKTVKDIANNSWSLMEKARWVHGDQECNSDCEAAF